MVGVDEVVLSLGILVSAVAVGAGIAEFSIPFGHQNVAIVGVGLIGVGIILSLIDL